MNIIQKEIRDDHQARLVVEFEAEKVEEVKRRAAAKVARRVKIPGFRPGKAPYKVVERHVGAGAILEEAIDLLIDETYPSIIKEAQLEPYGPGTLESIVSLEPLQLEFLVPLEPEVILGDYRSIRKPYEPKSVTEEEVEETLQGLREEIATLEPVDRPAQSGDEVTFLMTWRKQGAPEEDSKQDTFTLTLPSPEEESTNALLPKEVLCQLIGKSVGDEVTVLYAFPDNYSFEGFQGTQVEFRLKVQSVKQRVLPPLDDELAKTLGDFSSLEELRRHIRRYLEENQREAYHDDYDRDIITQAIDQATFKYPPRMVEDEVEKLREDLEQELKRYGISLDLYLKSRKMDEEGLRQELRERAERSIKQMLIIQAIRDAENIEFSEEELKQRATLRLNRILSSLPEKEATKYVGDERFLKSVVRTAMIELMVDHTVERLRSIASEGASDRHEGEALPTADVKTSSSQSEELPFHHGEPEVLEERGESVKPSTAGDTSQSDRNE